MNPIEKLPISKIRSKMSKKRLKTLLLLGILGLNYLVNQAKLDIQWTDLFQANYSISFFDQKVNLAIYASQKDDTAQYPRQKQKLTKKVLLWTLDQLETRINKMD